jgi:creatinine amidohydrolase
MKLTNFDTRAPRIPLRKTPMLRAMLPSPFWSELSLRDLRAHDMSRVIAVLPIAAVEQHGPHLPLGVDAMIMEG